MTVVINLYGGPGCGKSTSAAYLFSVLKGRGVNCELVREYVKSWAWEGRAPGTYDQMYLLGKQVRYETLLYGKVDVIVTDSPILLGIYYAERYSPPHVAHGVREMALSLYRQAEADGHRHVHVCLQRQKPYNPAGRFQTEEEAREIDGHVADMLRQFQFEQHTCPGNNIALEHMLDSVLQRT